MRVLFASLILVLFGGNLHAQQPGGSPPTLEVIHKLTPETGTIMLRRISIVMELRTVEEKVVVNGQAQTVTKTVTVPLEKEVQFAFNLAESRVVATDGKQLPIDDVWKRLKVNGVIALSGDGNVPPAAFLRALNSATLVLIPAPPKLIPMPK